jgi:hypothetical protein
MEIREITGVRTGPNHFTTVVPLRWVVDNCVSGLTLEQAERDITDGLAVDKRAAELAPFRAKLQRRFQLEKTEYRSRKGERIAIKVLKDQPKLKNSRGPLRDYLIQQFAPSPEEAFGVLPNFVVVFPEELQGQQVMPDSSGLMKDWHSYDFTDVSRAAIADGECRHLAATELRADAGVSDALKDKLLQQRVTVEIWHGIGGEQIAQMFCDLNFEGIHVDNITRANLDPRNKWISVTKSIFAKLDIELATDGRQITNAHRNENQHLLLTHAEQMVKVAILGYNATLSKSQKYQGPASWEGINFPKLEKACVRWFKTIFDHFGGPEVLADKSRVIRTIPARLALAELAGHFYRNDLEGQAHAMSVLEEINWLVSGEWDGIAGRVTQLQDGTSSLAASGSKEQGKRSHSALNNRQARSYWGVRGLTFPNDENK